MKLTKRLIEYRRKGKQRQFKKIIMTKANWLENISKTGAELYELYDDVRLFEKNNPMIFTVKNNAPPLAPTPTVSVFGANKNRFLSNSGNPVLVRIDYEYSTYSYEQLLANTMFAPFEIGTIRLESNLPINSRVLNITVQSPEGKSHTIAVTLQNRLNQFQTNTVELNVEDLKIPIDGDSVINFPIASGTQLKFYIYPSKMTSLKMLINTGALAKKYTTIQIPLTPNRDSITTPIDINYNDRKSLVAGWYQSHETYSSFRLLQA